uniref:MAG4940 family membrane protein n=1 Tax=Mycoplasmopsis bovis TaxID=28903 RepID=UPI003D2D73BF
LKSFKLSNLFAKEHHLTLGKFSAKEALFITKLITLLPFSAMIDTTNYQLNHFQIKLIELLVVGIIIFNVTFHQ